MYNQSESPFNEFNLNTDDKKCIYYSSNSKQSPKSSLLNYLNYDENSVYKYKLIERKKIFDELNNNEDIFINSIVSCFFFVIATKIALLIFIETKNKKKIRLSQF
jgi:hypothetical protein